MVMMDNSEKGLKYTGATCPMDDADYINRYIRGDAVMNLVPIAIAIAIGENRNEKGRSR
jgi:hypothetical protein